MDVASSSNPSTLTLLIFTVLNSPTVTRRLAPKDTDGATWYCRPRAVANQVHVPSGASAAGDERHGKRS